MTLRQTVEFLIFPKYFNVVSFYSKGHYSLTFKLIQVDSDGNLVTAYPILYQGRDCPTQQAKKPEIKIHNKDGSFTTEQFYVTYNEENFVLNSLCSFRLEYQYGKEYKTYLQISMNLTKYVNPPGNSNSRYDPQNSARSLSASKKQKASLELKVKKVYNVDKRTIYFNRKQSDVTQQLNNFKRVVFSQCEYFSYVDLYLGSVSLGSSFRAEKFQLCEFISMPSEEKVHYVLNLQTDNACSLPNKEKIGKQIYQHFSKSIFCTKLGSNEANSEFGKSVLCKYYDVMIVKAVKQYERLISVYNGINTKMIVLNNTSQLQQKIKMPLIHCLELSNQIGKDYTTIVNYYGYSNKDKNIIYHQILQESRAIYKNVLYLWQQFAKLILKTNLSVFRLLVIHQLSTKDSFVKKSAIIKNCQIQINSRSTEKNSFINKRKEILQSQLIYQDQDIYHPLLMIQGINSSTDQDRKFKIGLEVTSLTIFVHGYQGSDFDMEKAKNYLNLYNRETYSLLIKSISEDEEADIEQMGKSVSEEILSHLNNTPYQYKKINFIGYSLGGVVARQSLKYLQKYKNIMNIFVSFASPHLGIKNSENSLVNTGVWYLVNVSKVKAMKTLYNHSPNQNARSTLSKLSQCQGLSWFDRVVVVSSKQDNFVPYYSSRLQQVTDDEMTTMCRSLKLKIKKLERVQVWFDVQHDITAIDKFLGRRAHIQFLQNSGFLDSFFKIYGSSF